MSIGTLIHETGHNWGLSHSSIVHNGVSDEYGDSTDPMGRGGAYGDFSVFYKIMMGWIKKEEVQIIRKTGIYRIYPQLGAASNGLVKAFLLEKDVHWSWDTGVL